ncbi:MAG: DUF262 domain-containing protein [Burkholderiaceae bacterium]
MTNEIALIPDDQQEDEDDIVKPITFKDAVVLNADWTIETINLQIRKRNIDLQPGFQRRVAWDDTRKSRLLESIIVGMPVPNIVLAENKDHRGRFIVIDGKQRLVAISEFLEGGYRLKGLDIRSDLNDKFFSDLPIEDREYLENATLRSTLIRNWNDENFLYAIFFRLNSGSLPLSPQELRKALIGGNLLDAIEKYLLDSTSFKAIFGNVLDKRMRDSELVLRFLAFDMYLQDYQGDFKQHLDATAKYFESDWRSRETQATELFQRLDSALDMTYKIFGHDAFKKWLGDRYERVINRALFDCVARFFADPTVIQASAGKEASIVEAFKKLCLDRDFREAVEKTTKSVHATFFRVDRWGQDLAACIGKTYDQKTRRIS